MRRELLMLTMTLIAELTLATLVMLDTTEGAIAEDGNIYQTTLVEPNQKTPESSTAEIRRILTGDSAIVLDSRKREECEASHIPSARNIDAPPSEYIVAVERLVGGDKTKALVLYCNGPFC